MTEPHTSRGTFRVEQPEKLAKGVKLLGWSLAIMSINLCEVPIWLVGLYLMGYACAFVLRSFRQRGRRKVPALWLCFIPAAIAWAVAWFWSYPGEPPAVEEIQIRACGTLLMSVPLLYTLRRLAQLMRAMGVTFASRLWLVLLVFHTIAPIGSIIMFGLTLTAPGEATLQWQYNAEVLSETGVLVIPLIILALLLFVVYYMVLYEACKITRAAIFQRVAETSEPE